MLESGILSEDDRVELIDGEIRNMSPIGPYHAAVVTRVLKLLTSRAGEDVIVSPQNPVRLNDYSEPQPDIALLRYRDDYYAAAHPGANDILLLIEVADTTLKYDRNEKLPRYAAANVPEAWIINLEEQLVEQYTQPKQGQYTHIQRVLPGETLTSSTLPGIALQISNLL